MIPPFCHSPPANVPSPRTAADIGGALTGDAANVGYYQRQHGETSVFDMLSSSHRFASRDTTLMSSTHCVQAPQDDVQAETIKPRPHQIFHQRYTTTAGRAVAGAHKKTSVAKILAILRAASEVIDDDKFVDTVNENTTED